MKTLLLVAEDGDTGVGGGVTGRVWRRGGKVTDAKAGQGLDGRADRPVVTEVSI